MQRKQAGFSRKIVQVWKETAQLAVSIQWLVQTGLSPAFVPLPARFENPALAVSVPGLLVPLHIRRFLFRSLLYVVAGGLSPSGSGLSFPVDEPLPRSVRRCFLLPAFREADSVKKIYQYQ